MLSLPSLLPEHLGLLDLPNQLDFLTDDIVGKGIHAVVYTDGGSVGSGPREAGSGIHGYFYLDEEVKHKSKCPKGYPTKKGYLTKKGEKTKLVNVLGFFDISLAIGDRTNNYAELLATMVGTWFVNQFKPTRIHLLSDSKYVLDNTVNHLDRWVDNDFISNGKELANKELWLIWHELYQQVQEDTKFTLEWVKGHEGEIGNTLADYNATQAIRLGSSPITKDTLLYRAGTPKDYHEREHGLSPLLSERRLILDPYATEETYYYQMTMGSRWASKEEERRQQIGKRISDTLISVVKLKERNPLLTQLEWMCRKVSDMCNVAVCRLDLLTQGTLYSDIMQTEGKSLKIEDSKIKTVDGVELVNELTEARLSWRILPMFEQLAMKLDEYLGLEPKDEETNTQSIDITDQLFDIETNKKGNVVYTVKDFDENNVIEITVDTVFGENQTLRLTGSVDLPSTLGLKRLAKVNPKVTLLVWADIDSRRVIHYATIMETDTEAGIWMAAYANLHVITKE